MQSIVLEEDSKEQHRYWFWELASNRDVAYTNITMIQGKQQVQNKILREFRKERVLLRRVRKIFVEEKVLLGGCGSIGKAI